MDSDAIENHTILFFRVYREINVPLYGTMIRRICSSSSVPFEFATVLEDIGQAFIQLSDEINAELSRRGVLGDEADADDTIEARAAEMVETMLTPFSTHGDILTDPAGRPFSADVMRQTLKVAVALAHDLPVARPVMESGAARMSPA